MVKSFVILILNQESFSETNVPNFKRIKLTISYGDRPGIKMMPISLSTAFQPLPSKLLEYTQTEFGSTLANSINSSGLGSLYSLGLYGRDFKLDDEDDTCCIQ